MNLLLRIRDYLSKLGLVGERKAVALLLLGFFTAVFGLLALLLSLQLPEWWPCYAGLGAVYLVGFFALAADWFWGRWYAIGLGSSGMVAVALLIVLSFLGRVDVPAEALPILAIYGGTHALLWLLLHGETMAVSYEAQTAWRRRWSIDDDGVLRLRRSVTRAASSLPTLVMWALGPREDAAALAATALAVIGLLGLVRLRTLGVVAVGAAGLVAALATLRDGAPLAMDPTAHNGSVILHQMGNLASSGQLLSGVSALLLLAAAAPFARPLVRFLGRRS